MVDSAYAVSEGYGPWARGAAVEVVFPRRLGRVIEELVEMELSYLQGAGPEATMDDEFKAQRIKDLQEIEKIIDNDSKKG